jgi:hypothetical protein
MLKGIQKQSCYYIFCNTGREDFDLLIQAEGFYEVLLPVFYDSLDALVPSIRINLVPSEKNKNILKMLELKGKMEGISSLDGVDTKTILCRTNEYFEKKQELSLFNPNNLPMDQNPYAIIHAEYNLYEPIAFIKAVSTNLFRIKPGLVKEYAVNLPVSRLLSGQIYEDGSYVFRIRDNGSDLKYLIRYVVNGSEYFKLLDFHQKNSLTL